MLFHIYLSAKNQKEKYCIRAFLCIKIVSILHKISHRPLLKTLTQNFSVAVQISVPMLNVCNQSSA